MSVPARFMRTRLILIFTVLALSIFGCVMIYSARSIVLMEQRQDPALMGYAQFKHLIAGLIVAFALKHFNYQWLTKKIVIFTAWFCVSAILAYTIFKGSSAKGATRWLQIGSQVIQPSEFTKPFFVLLGVYCICFIQDCKKYTEFKRMGIAALLVILPTLLILGQPDKGGTAIIAGTLLIMIFLSGIIDAKLFFRIAFIGLAGLLLYSMHSDYSWQRIMVLFDPMAHRYGAAYQIIQGRIAFGSGGLIGVGIGEGGSKYSYLPEAHNDFILAVIGEECGFIGTVAIVFAFCVILYCAYDIAKNANDKKGMLIASGAGSMLMLQFLLNALGELGIIPLSGKPVPFLSYGGSSLITSYMLFGLMWCVSYHSRLPETKHDKMRRRMKVASNGAPKPRSKDTNDFTVISGGGSDFRRSTKKDTRPNNINLNSRSNDRNKRR